MGDELRFLSAEDLDALTPDERPAAFRERIVTDPEGIPAEFRERVHATGRGLAQVRRTHR